MNKLIYPVNIGGYDNIYKPRIVTPGWDYIYVTDTPKQDTGWNVLPYNDDNPSWLTSRRPKIKFHEFFDNYDLSIYIDSSIEVNVNLDEFVEKRISDSADMAMMQHPSRFCVYEEIKACVFHEKMDKRKSAEIGNKYKAEGVPRCEGLIQAGIMIRKHNRPNLNKFCDLWFEETKFTTRDQLSFMYTYHKYKIISYNLFSAYNTGLKINTHLCFL